MGTLCLREPLGEALFGKVRRSVLGLLYGQTEGPLHVSEIVRRVGAGRGAVQRELTNLAAAGLLVRSDRGNLTLYEANADCPIYAELRALMVKTAGVLAVLQEALQPLSEAIAVAFVYGSVAAGTQTANSDVDLLVVGDVSFGQVVACLGPAQGQLGREVNPTVYQREEFGRELAAQTHFLRAVMTGPRFYVLGGDDELSRLAGAGAPARTPDKPAGD